MSFLYSGGSSAYLTAAAGVLTAANNVLSGSPGAHFDDVHALAKSIQAGSAIAGNQPADATDLARVLGRIKAQRDLLAVAVLAAQAILADAESAYSLSATPGQSSTPPVVAAVSH